MKKMLRWLIFLQISWILTTRFETSYGGMLNGVVTCKGKPEPLTVGSFSFNQVETHFNCSGSPNIETVIRVTKGLHENYLYKSYVSVDGNEGIECCYMGEEADCGYRSYDNIYAGYLFCKTIRPKNEVFELTIPGILSESDIIQTIAECQLDTYERGPVAIMIEIEETIVSVSNSGTFNYSTGTLSTRVVYQDAIRRRYNGKSINCIVKHINSHYIKMISKTLIIFFQPEAPILSGNTYLIEADKGNFIRLNCTSSSSNPRSNIAWLINNILTINNAAIHTYSAEDHGHVVSQLYEVEARRNLDGKTAYCTSMNIVNLNTPVKSDEKIFDLVYHPIVTMSKGIEVTEGVGAYITCSVSAKPQPNFTWYKNGQYMPGLSTDLENTSIIAIDHVDRTHGGSYQCQVRNGYEPHGIGLTNLSVKFRPLSIKLSGVTNGVVVNRENYVLLNCSSGSSNPKSDIKWYRNNVFMQNNATVLVFPGEYYKGKITSQMLKFRPERDMDGDEFYCTVKNDVGKKNGVMSDKRKLNLLYHPVITLSRGGTVAEGTQKIFRCMVHSKPSSNISWYHNNSVLSNTQGVLGNISEYIISSVNRSQAGWYRCRGENGLLPRGNDETLMVVNFAPDVVVTSNVTLENKTANLNCHAVGVPNKYTFSEWQHFWPGFGRVKHPRSLGNNSLLTLTPLTYEYSGIYKCSVSNGVEASLNPNAGYGITTLLVETHPIIPDTKLERITSQLHKNTTFIIEYYTNSDINEVKCFRKKTEFKCSVSQTEGEINLPLFLTTIRTIGIHARITFTIADSSMFGLVSVRIGNRIGASEKMMDIIPEGPPEMPMLPHIDGYTRHTVTISWVPGFDGGFDQTFAIQYRTDTGAWISISTNNRTNETIAERLTETIKDLESETTYYIRIQSQNRFGESEYTPELKFTSENEELTKHTFILLIIATVTGGVVVIVIIAVVVCTITRRRRKILREKVREKERLAKHAYANVVTVLDQNVRRDEEINTSIHRNTYESLQGIDAGGSEYSRLHEHKGFQLIGEKRDYVNLRLTPIRS